jgi:hypothetical protein
MAVELLVSKAWSVFLSGEHVATKSSSVAFDASLAFVVSFTHQAPDESSRCVLLCCSMLLCAAYRL